MAAALPAVALRRTGALAADALVRRDGGGRDARLALRGVAARLPAALRARRPLPPSVEEAARRVDRAGRPGRGAPPGGAARSAAEREASVP